MTNPHECAVKQNWKLTNIWHSYRKKYCGYLSDSRCSLQLNTFVFSRCWDLVPLSLRCCYKRNDNRNTVDYKALRFSTFEVLLDEDVVVLLNLVMTTVRVMRGSATESRWLPVTVTSVPPLKTKNMFTAQTTIVFSIFWNNNSMTQFSQLVTNGFISWGITPNNYMVMSTAFEACRLIWFCGIFDVPLTIYSC